jgi:hypothetical protein
MLLKIFAAEILVFAAPFGAAMFSQSALDAFAAG